MTKPGRNDPCPCGSGKKHKKCHLAETEAAAAIATKARMHAVQADLLTRKIELRATRLQMRYDLDEEEDDDRVLTDEYNDLTNVVRAGRLDEAETRAKALSARFPHAPHGLEALGYAYDFTDGGWRFRGDSANEAER